MNESFGVRGVRGCENAGASLVELLSPTGVHRDRGHVADPGVPVLVVVPEEERLTETPCVLDRTETVGESRPILSVLNCASEYGLSVEV